MVRDGKSALCLNSIRASALEQLQASLMSLLLKEMEIAVSSVSSMIMCLCSKKLETEILTLSSSESQPSQNKSLSICGNKGARNGQKIRVRNE